jgi:hypothetical protein
LSGRHFAVATIWHGDNLSHQEKRQFVGQQSSVVASKQSTRVRNFIPNLETSYQGKWYEVQSRETDLVYLFDDRVIIEKYTQPNKIGIVFQIKQPSTY